MPGAILYVKHPTSGELIPVKADADGKLVISDADPFTVAQATPESLKHVPHGYYAAGTAYLPYAVDADGKLLTAAAISGNLDDLNDVNVPSPTDGYVLTWDAATSLWIASAIPATAWAAITGKPTSPSLEEMATEHDASGHHTVKLDDLAAPDDNTDLNASASAHGLLPKLSNVVTQFLNGQGGFTVPAGGGGTGLTTAYKPDDEVVNNSKTLQDDDDLVFSIAASEIWYFEFFLNSLSGTTPKIKYALILPSGATLRACVYSINPSGAQALQLLASASAVNIAGAGVTDGTHNVLTRIYGYVLNSTTAGTVQLQWAQNTADASDTTVKAGSYLVANKLA